MKKSKKVIALAVSLVLVLTVVGIFAACNKKPNDPKPQTPADASAFKVGAIYIGSRNDAAGYTYQHAKGISDAMKALGLPAANLIIQDNVPEDDAQVASAIDTLAGQGCKIIFGISFGYMNAMNEAAKKTEYKDIIFSHATGYMSSDSNFNNYFGRIYQSRYLTGLAAGLKSLELKNNNIGYVSAYGTEYAETCSGINAFTLGARAANPNATVWVNKINTWGDETLEKQAAENLVNTHNVCVIGQHCDSAQPQLVAQNGKLFGIGYNSDMSVDAPNATLTSAIWHWDVYYKLAIETAMKDPAKFMEKVGIYYGGLKEGFVDTANINEKVAAAGTDKAMKAVRDLIISGEWDVFSNIKLSVDKEGKITKTTEALEDNKGNVVISADNSQYYVMNKDTKKPELVDGGASKVDSIIKGSMNYFVKGVEAE